MQNFIDKYGEPDPGYLLDDAWRQDFVASCAHLHSKINTFDYVPEDFDNYLHGCQVLRLSQEAQGPWQSLYMQWRNCALEGGADVLNANTWLAIALIDTPRAIMLAERYQANPQLAYIDAQLSAMRAMTPEPYRLATLDELQVQDPQSYEKLSRVMGRQKLKAYDVNYRLGPSGSFRGYIGVN